MTSVNQVILLLELENCDYDLRMLIGINGVPRRMISTNQSLPVSASVRYLAMNINTFTV